MRDIAKGQNKNAGMMPPSDDEDDEDEDSDAEVDKRMPMPGKGGKGGGGQPATAGTLPPNSDDDDDDDEEDSDSDDDDDDDDVDNYAAGPRVRKPEPVIEKSAKEIQAEKERLEAVRARRAEEAMKRIGKEGFDRFAPAGSSAARPQV